MNTDPVTLFSGNSRVTIEPVTETLGIVGEHQECIHPPLVTGDLVELPDWFLGTNYAVEHQTLWQAAAQPYYLTETLITPSHLIVVPVLDMDKFEHDNPA